jgi:hypothetical protein
MKYARYRFLALVLVLCLLIGALPAAAFTIAGVGEVTVLGITPLSDKATLTRNTVRHVTAGQQAERYIEWNSGGQIRPIVVTGDTVFGGTLTLDEAAAKATAAGMSVAAGMNGDFFTVSTGVPVGLTVVNRRILVSDPGLPAVGFYPDGQAFISRPALRTTMTVGTRAINIEHINKPRGTNGLHLFTSDFGENTRTTTPGRNIILQVHGSDTLTVGGVIHASIIDIIDSSAPVNLLGGFMCLSAESAEAIALLNGLSRGMSVTISTMTGDVRYLQCDYIIGGFRMLLENGSIVAPAEPIVTRAPRTAIGIKADGTVVYYTVDGRQGAYSAGMGLNELAARLRALDCVIAVELDGGGSTDMTARMPGDFELTRLGRPSDGNPRRVANHIIFINTAPRTGTIRNLFVKSGRIAALTGADIPFSGINVTAMDTNFHPVQVPSNLSWSSSNAQVATVAGSLRAVAAGTATLTVSSGAGVRGSFDIMVADQPDSIVILDAATNKPIDTELSLAPNERLSLRAVGLVNGLEAPGGNFYWATANNSASVDANGVLTAGSMAGTSTRLIVGMGEYVTSINVLIGRAPSALENFENRNVAFSATAVGTGFERNSNKQHVRYGLWSGAFSYDFSVAAAGTAALTYSADIILEGNPNYLSLWVKGDGSGNMLNVVMTDSAGQTTERIATTLNFTDYRQIFVPLVNISKISGLKIDRAPNGSSSGTFYVDQVLAVSSNVPNISAPAISLSLNADGVSLNINGSAIDHGGTLLNRSNIGLTINGSPIPFEFNEATGAVTASRALPTEGVHVVTLTAMNHFGNYDRITREFDQPTIYRSQSFNDISTHWAGKYIELLDRREVIRENTVFFRPSDVITRAEVAVMMSNVLKLDETAWSNIVLPYDDLSEIPAWAMGAVRALYGNGFMTGVGLANGRRIFSPNSSFSRAEMFGIIGHSIPRGITKSAVGSTFTDYHTVPSWSVEYVDLLIGMGIITGSNNRLNPSDTVTRAEFATILARIT